MSVGIDFTLRANTSAFTKGLAAVDNATGKLQKSLANKFEGRDLARGLTTALGLSVDKIAEKFARMWTGVTEEAEEAFKEMASLSDILTEKTINAGRRRLTDVQKLELVVQDAARLEQRIADNRGRTAVQQNQLAKDKIALLDKQAEAEELNAKIQKDSSDKQIAALKHEKDLRDQVEKANEEWQKDAMQELKLAEESDRELADANRERFAPSVEQLAGMDVGTGVGQNDPRLVAKRILEKEKFAAEAAGRGDITGALRLGGEATAMREGISGMTGNGALTAASAKTAFTDALTKTNEVLTEIRDGQSGLIKAQP